MRLVTLLGTAAAIGIASVIVIEIGGPLDTYRSDWEHWTEVSSLIGLAVLGFMILNFSPTEPSLRREVELTVLAPAAIGGWLGFLFSLGGEFSSIRYAETIVGLVVCGVIGAGFGTLISLARSLAGLATELRQRPR